MNRSNIAKGPLRPSSESHLLHVPPCQTPDRGHVTTPHGYPHENSMKFSLVYKDSLYIAKYLDLLDLPFGRFLLSNIIFPMDDGEKKSSGIIHHVSQGIARFLSLFSVFFAWIERTVTKGCFQK